MQRGAAFEEARRLVTAEGTTYAQAAAATGIPLATLQKRAASEGWQDQRATRATYAATARACKVALLARLQKAIDDPTATSDDIIKNMAAWEKAERSFPEFRYGDRQLDPKARLAAGVEMLETVVEFLAAHDPATLEVFRPHLVPLGRAWEAACG